MDAGVVFPLTNSMLHPDVRQQKGALQCLKQLATADEYQIEIARIIDLNQLGLIMQSKNKELAEEATWTMMTIAQNSVFPAPLALHACICDCRRNKSTTDNEGGLCREVAITCSKSNNFGATASDGAGIGQYNLHRKFFFFLRLATNA